jgi:hypothetical protein
MLTLCKIDGKSYDVLVTAIDEKTEIIEGANSGLALFRQREIRDIKGVKIGHAVTFAPDNDVEAFDALYDYLFKSIRPSVNVEIVHGQKTINYEAAYNTCNRRVSHIDDENDIVFWDEMTVDFRPIENQIDAG